MKYAYMLILVLVTACSKNADNQGVVLDLDRDRSISYETWLPTMDLKTNPSPKSKEKRLPLIVISHGSGGDYANHSWLIDAFVDNGFIVVGLNHPLNTTTDNTDVGVVSVWLRPTDITKLLDHLLNESKWATTIDAERIGAAGFSSGGYTVLALAGARYNAELMQAYCASEESGKDCELATDFSNVDYTGSSYSYSDARIKSVFAMAQAIGSAITLDSLASIRRPIFIIAATDDELVPPHASALRYAKNIPNSELILLPSGGHFIFLQCNAIIKVVDWFNTDLDLCGTQFDVDRGEVRKEVATIGAEFFGRTLGLKSGGEECLLQATKCDP